MDTHDMQGLVLSGYGHLGWASYLFFRFSDSQLAREWLGQATAEVTPAIGSREDPSGNLNIALTHRGLATLGLDEEALASFPRSFRAGMADQRQSARLGDHGESHPCEWDWGGPAHEVDVMLMLFARNEDPLDEWRGQWRASARRALMEEVAEVTSQPLPKRDREHFGYRDGISQPMLEGTPGAAKLPADARRWSLVAPGEFVLGYVDGCGERATGPTVDADQDPWQVLPADPDRPGRADFCRNGSYLVARQLVQHVKQFHEFIDRTAARAERRSDPLARERLMAELLGRWPSGAPLVKAPTAPRPDLDRDNAFGYADHDPAGMRCPIGAHIRRANPRDSLGDDPDEALRSANRHRLLRRGRPYGPPFTSQTDGAPRGMLFICLNADIERQFEFVQQQWINNPNFDGLTGEDDPLLGDGGMFTEQGTPVRRRIPDLKRFVTVKGGAYFFLPSLRALRYLASLS